VVTTVDSTIQPAKGRGTVPRRTRNSNKAGTEVLLEHRRIRRRATAEIIDSSDSGAERETEVDYRPYTEEEPQVEQTQASEPSTESDIELSSWPASSAPSPDSTHTPLPTTSSHTYPTPDSFPLRPAVFTPPASATVHPIPITTTGHTPSVAFSMIDVPWFYGDHTDAGVAHDWLKKLRQLFRVTNTTSDASRIEAFEDYIRTGSTAATWYSKLATTDKDTWEHLQSAFKIRWPETPASTETIPDLTRRLLAHRLADEDVSRYIDVGGRQELGHVAWANAVQHLFNAIGSDPTGLVVTEVRRGLPEVLRNAMPTSFPDYTALLNAVRAVNSEEIERQRTALMLVHAFNNFAIPPAAHALAPPPQTPQHARPHAAPRATTVPAPTPLPTSRPTATVPATQTPLRPQTLAPNPYQTPGRPTGQNHLFGNYATPSTTPRPRPALPPITHRYATLSLNVKEPAATTDEYNTALTAWHKAHNRQIPDENRPYPLRPGTSPAGSGECYKCGHKDHFASMCPNPDSAPPLEVDYRAIAGFIVRQANASPGCPTPVRYTSSASTSSDAGSSDSFAIPQMRQDGSIEWVYDNQGNGAEQG
jgi:hypothetical protein